MPKSGPCPYCHRSGLIRVEHVITAARVYRDAYCGACNRSWRITDSGERVAGESSPPDRSRNEAAPVRPQRKVK